MSYAEVVNFAGGTLACGGAGADLNKSNISKSERGSKIKLNKIAAKGIQTIINSVKTQLLNFCLQSVYFMQPFNSFQFAMSHLELP